MKPLDILFIQRYLSYSRAKKRYPLFAARNYYSGAFTIAIASITSILRMLSIYDFSSNVPVSLSCFLCVFLSCHIALKIKYPPVKIEKLLEELETLSLKKRANYIIVMVLILMIPSLILIFTSIRYK